MLFPIFTPFGSIVLLSKNFFPSTKKAPEPPKKTTITSKKGTKKFRDQRQQYLASHRNKANNDLSVSNSFLQKNVEDKQKQTSKTKAKPAEITYQPENDPQNQTNESSFNFELDVQKQTNINSQESNKSNESGRKTPTWFEDNRRKSQGTSGGETDGCENATRFSNFGGNNFGENDENEPNTQEEKLANKNKETNKVMTNKFAKKVLQKEKAAKGKAAAAKSKATKGKEKAKPTRAPLKSINGPNQKEVNRLLTKGRKKFIESSEDDTISDSEVENSAIL